MKHSLPVLDSAVIPGRGQTFLLYKRDDSIKHGSIVRIRGKDWTVRAIELSASCNMCLVVRELKKDNVNA